MLDSVVKKIRKMVFLQDEIDLLEIVPEPDIKTEARRGGQEYVRNLLLASNITALAAKLAKCDGPITAREVENFQHVFTLPKVSLDYIKLFADAATDRVGLEHYATRINTFFSEQPEIMQQLLSDLFSFAACDAPINFDEVIFLKKVSLALGLDNQGFKDKLKAHFVPKGIDAFEILAVDRKISAPELKKVYYEAVQLYHPDKIAHSMPIPEVISVVNERLAAINEAYEKITQAKNF